MKGLILYQFMCGNTQYPVTFGTLNEQLRWTCPITFLRKKNKIIILTDFADVSFPSRCTCADVTIYSIITCTLVQAGIAGTLVDIYNRRERIINRIN